MRVRCVAVVVLALGIRASAAAQTLGRPAAPGDVETDPIKCWWKTDKSAVVVGERFALTITCGVIETSRIKVVPDLSQLEPTVLPVSPFEVVRGVTHEDVVSPPWRYFQREYVVRLVADAFFGKDVDIPPVKVGYRLRSTTGAGTEGRDQSYVLPALPMHVNSIVPRRATDIRDAAQNTFSTIEARRQGAMQKSVVATIAFGFSTVLAALALVRVVGRYRTRKPAVARPLPVGTVVANCLRDAGRVRSQVARDGWTPELIGRALTSLRIAGTVALGRPVGQTVVDRHTPPREGQLAVRTGTLRPKRALVSTAVTPGAIAGTLANGHALGARTQAILTDLHDSLRVLSTARYGRNGHLDTTALDTALDNSIDAMRRLRRAKTWPVRTAETIVKSAAELVGRA